MIVRVAKPHVFIFGANRDEIGFSNPSASQNSTADALLIIGRLLDLTYLFRLLGSSGSFGILGVPEGSLALARPKGDKLDSLGIV